MSTKSWLLNISSVSEEIVGIFDLFTASGDEKQDKNDEDGNSYRNHVLSDRHFAGFLVVAWQLDFRYVTVTLGTHVVESTSDERRKKKIIRSTVRNVHNVTETTLQVLSSVNENKHRQIPRLRSFFSWGNEGKNIDQFGMKKTSKSLHSNLHVFDQIQLWKKQRFTGILKNVK